MDNLTLFESLMAANKKIYVINNTEPKGLLSTTIHDPISGKALKLEFPRTWIPFCLTSMLPRNVLEHNIELRRTLQKNTLKIISEEQALALLSTERGQKEYQRLNTSEFSAGSHTSSERKNNLIATVRSSAQDKTSLTGTLQGDKEEDLVLHTKMRAWEQRVVTGEFDGSTLINELEIHSNELSSDDLNFLLVGQFPQEVKEYAQERLNTGGYKTKNAASVGTIPTDKYDNDWSFEVQ